MPVISEPEASDGLTFLELIEEFRERGFDDFSAESARVKRWVNQAYREVVDARPWPFLEGEIEDTAPVTIENLGHVLSVADATTKYPLDPVDRRTVVRNLDASLEGTGPPSLWYQESDETIAVYPKNTTNTIQIRFLANPPKLEEDSDKVWVPYAYCDLIVDGAVIKGLKHRSAWEEVTAARTEWERELAQMTHALLKPNYDAPKLIRRTGSVGDYA